MKKTLYHAFRNQGIEIIITLVFSSDDAIVNNTFNSLVVR